MDGHIILDFSAPVGGPVVSLRSEAAGIFSILQKVEAGGGEAEAEGRPLHGARLTTLIPPAPRPPQHGITALCDQARSVARSVTRRHGPLRPGFEPGHELSPREPAVIFSLKTRIMCWPLIS